MTIRAKLVAVIVLVNLAIAVAGIVVMPSFRAQDGLEPGLRGHANRISMAVVIDAALREMHYQAELARRAVAAGGDPASALDRVRQELGGALGQLAFLGSGDPTNVAEVRALLATGAETIDVLAQQRPFTPETAAELAATTLDLQYRAGRLLTTLQEADNSGGLQQALAGLADLRRHMDLALASAGGALLLSLGLSVFAYRRLIQPLGAVTGSLNAVLTGHQPNQRLQETQDEFGDIVRAIRKLQAQAEHIRRIAYEDPGTGLPNRNSLDAELREVRRLRPIDGTHGLIAIGFDTYDHLRSGFGIRVAESVMRVAAQRLHGLDPMPVSVFRLEPQILGVLVDRGIAEAVTRADLKRIAAEAFTRLAAPVEVDEQRYLLGVSAGAAIYPDDARDAEEYVNVCLEAQRQARAVGSGHLRFGERGHTHRLRKHLALAEQIRTGLRSGQFVPYFQPVVDAAKGKVVGAEILVRWRQPDGRVILPGEFILIAESSETIRDMTREVLVQACQSIRSWSDQGLVLSVSFNLSAKLLSPHILGICREALAASGLPASQLVAEVTETALVGNLDGAEEVLRALRDNGVRLCLDDFGTGYSSLMHLYRFPIDRIKIDPVITRAVSQTTRAAEIVRSMAMLAARLGLSIVVEGIETDEEAQRLRDLGCSVQQGFLYSRAMPEEQFVEWSRQFEARAAAA
ncbi:bifunctional diguanylate cyclase/phosphodiesterase [Fontimonas sp. SYSU GA230001]|uniref:putative bifunctional diguanylate cyclase/phosphodiesterase n=1 Tax=Fontimonas sp. SYSU GA230001 TaxID=3142450 RepID=UPI0032B45F34